MEIPADELAEIRALNTSWLNQTCTISSPGTEQTSSGWSTDEPTEQSDVPCRLETASSRGGQERIGGEGVVSAAPWNIVLPHTVVVKPQDTITVDDVGVFSVVSSTSGRGVQTDVVAACVKADA